MKTCNLRICEKAGILPISTKIMEIPFIFKRAKPCLTIVLIHILLNNQQQPCMYDVVNKISM
jgi:hypothetical protein